VSSDRSWPDLRPSSLNARDRIIEGRSSTLTSLSMFLKADCQFEVSGHSRRCYFGVLAPNSSLRSAVTAIARAAMT